MRKDFYSFIQLVDDGKGWGTERQYLRKQNNKHKQFTIKYGHTSQKWREIINKIKINNRQQGIWNGVTRPGERAFP